MSSTQMFDCAQCGDPECALSEGAVCFGCFYDNEHPNEVAFEGDVVAEAEDYLADFDPDMPKCCLCGENHYGGTCG